MEEVKIIKNIQYMDICIKCSENNRCKHQKNDITKCHAYRRKEIGSAFLLKFSIAVIIFGLFCGFNEKLFSIVSICFIIIIGSAFIYSMNFKK